MTKTSTKSIELEGGAARLTSEVIDKDRCAVCGACVGSCPYLVHYNGRVILTDRCTLDAGRCYGFCPMGGARGKFEGEIGPYEEVLIAQAARVDILKKSQYGGVASTLTNLALKQGLVDEAVVTSGHPEEPPEGVRVRNRAEVLAAAGSRYAASGAVAALNEALAEKGSKPLLMVGTPCQVKAAAAMRDYQGDDPPFNPKRIKVLIGLFCTWALDYRRLSRYLRFMLFGERASGYDIPPPPADVFKVYTGDGIKAFPLEEIREMRLNACRFCDDMTSTRADISVGAVEGLDGWNTVIVRTKTGRRLMDLARDKKLLHLDELPQSDLEHLKEASALKKARSEKTWREEE